MSLDSHVPVPGGPPNAPDPDHPLQAGSTVSVIRFSLKRPPFLEGRAFIRDAARGRHRYRVQFLRDPRYRIRFVHPAYQNDPEGWLTCLIELWRASLRPDSHDDFYTE